MTRPLRVRVSFELTPEEAEAWLDYGYIDAEKHPLPERRALRGALIQIDTATARALERIARALEVATGTAPKRTPRTPAAPSRQPTELDRARAVRALRRHGIAE
jgi:hypothetical protein